MTIEDDRALLSHLRRRYFYLRGRGEAAPTLAEMAESIQLLERAVEPVPEATVLPWDRLLGTMPDSKVAGIFDVSEGTVRRRRSSLGVEPYRRPMAQPRPWDHLLGTMTDRALSEAVGCSRGAVCRRRHHLKIPPYRRHS